MSILEILSRHIADVCNHGDIECRCGEQCDTPEAHRAHLAEVLDKHMQEREYRAWQAGVDTALNHAILNPDGITLRLEHLDGRPWANPYRKEPRDGRE